MIVVTGGAGFIGSNLVHGLNARGQDRILIVDNLTRAAKHLNLSGLRFWDYADKDDFLALLPSLPIPEAIFHQGACSDTTGSDGRYMMRNNYTWSKSLLAYAMAHGVPFIYASSAAVYGDGRAGFREHRQCEYPLNVYGYSKLAFDNYVRMLDIPDGQQVMGLRYFNVYGPQENHKARMASVAWHLFGQLADGGTAQIFEGSDGFVRDFIHVDDVVEVNLHFLQSPRSGILNCGTGQERSFQDLARVCRSLVGRGEIEYIPFPQDLRGKYQSFTRADLTELRRAGYDKPFLTLEAGLARYAEVVTASGGYYRT
ncbi:MAG: ADP-glyceromanno-heptose 6-epimerase [Rhodospirillales bacterium]